jgi:hypothetical protein
MSRAPSTFRQADAITTYRKHNKPALGPLGDSLDDLGAAKPSATIHD